MTIFVGANPASQADYDSGPSDAIAIVLSEATTGPEGVALARWELEVESYNAGKVATRVGRILTSPPNGYSVSYGAPVQRAAARIVAIAVCPGSVRWRVTGRALPWNPPGYLPSLATPAYDPEAARRRARADCVITPTEPPTSAPGIQLVNASAPSDVQEVVTIVSTQVGVAAVAQQLLPDDDNRVRALVRVVSGGPVFIGAQQVTVGNGLPLLAGDPPLVWTPRRPLFGIAAAASVVAVLVDGG